MTVGGPIRPVGPGARLEAALAGRARAVDDDPSARRAAVAVVLTEEEDPALLFIRRIVREGDPWSGQMAFPGGFRSHPGEPLEETAVRETKEETGLDLGRSARAIGVLDDLNPRTPLLPPIVIRPFAFLVPSRRPLVPGAEAEAALWVPLDELLAAENQTTIRIRWTTGERTFPAIEAGGRTIWGLTERILRQVVTLATT